MGEILEAGDEGFTLEHAYVGAGEPWRAGEDGSWSATPARMWHEGRMRPGRPEAVFSPEWTRPGLTRYGPQLPVPAGRYLAEIKFVAEGAGGDEAGDFRVTSVRGGRTFGRVALRAGETGAVTEAFEMPSDPIRFEVWYSGRGQLTVRGLRLVPEG